MDDAPRIADVEAVPDNGTTVFRVRDGSGEEREAFLVGTGDGVACWLNYCRHLTHVRLDKGDGALVRGDEVVCTNHGATFAVDTGYCTFGPCEGAYLEPVEVAVADGGVYLTDADYTFVGPGPMDRDPADRTSTSNIEF